MASRFVTPFFDSGDGIQPSDGSKLFFFSTGTSSPKDTFSDEALTTPNANPVIADANGLFSDIFLPDGGRYKVQLKDKNDVQQWESDPVVGGISSITTKTFDTVAVMVASKDLNVGDIVETAGYTTKGDGGKNQYEIVAAATGTDDGGSFIDLTGITGQAKGLFPGGVTNVKQFGAIGDGIADDTTAVTNAGATNKAIFVPEGTYDITGTLTGDFVAFGSVTITTGTLNFLTTIGSEDITIANILAINKGSDTSLDNLAIGQNALIDALLTSTLNIAIGTGALQNATTSGGGEDGSNTAIGRSSMQNLTTGFFNAALGTTAGQGLTTAFNCTAVGRAAQGHRAQGNDNTAVGREAMFGEIGTAATSHTAFNCTAVGVSALHDVIGGDRNSAFGRSALDKLTSGNDNLALGESAGNAMTTGSGNVIIGGYSGNAGGLDITTASNRIVLSDGVGSIRMNFDGSGNAFIGKTAASLSTAGVELRALGAGQHTVAGANVMFINRLTDDGNLVQFYQDSTLEGSISVAGTTVSYNGGHLSRWSRLIDDSKPEILKGTLMSNLDSMIYWEGKNNEQLNHTEISSTVDDKNVAGVFVAWDTEGGYNDYRLAQTGDMVIRVSPGETVARGDLLTSNGDGTAKVQTDDLIRSSTIAKVISSAVSETYPDGSYAIPCVLMAC